ncbi:ATP-binding protein [Streptomyces sp. GS7]|uniref:ATP-binding protein n=1 Tax=Streptomyces sp. GS7 TaxID=2692234 RepID=UPI001F321390|nr:sensor histidine kinase [Streptomyces sp. GS7]
MTLPTTEPVPAPMTGILEVRDRGPGFPPAFLPFAFERFHRADPGRGGTHRCEPRSGTPPEGSRSGGAGLGPAIVAAIARAYGGRATADNPPGGGARVRLHLPLDAAGPETHGPAPGRRVRPPVRPPALPGHAPQSPRPTCQHSHRPYTVASPTDPHTGGKNTPEPESIR